jgi:hypothetical protein
VKSWLLRSAARVLVHINRWPSGEKTGNTSAAEESVNRVIFPGAKRPFSTE